MCNTRDFLYTLAKVERCRHKTIISFGKGRWFTKCIIQLQENRTNRITCYRYIHNSLWHVTNLLARPIFNLKSSQKPSETTTNINQVTYIRVHHQRLNIVEA